MKLRIKGNSLRFRLLQSEVNRLAEGERIEEFVQLASEPGAGLTYALEANPSEQYVRVVYTPTRWLVLLSAAQVSAWAASDQVGLYETLTFTPHATLEVAIEKDFACLDLSDAENADTFAHPHADKPC